VDIAYSINGVPIRLTDERWLHILDSHDALAGWYDDILDTVENPDLVLPGQRGSLIAVRGVASRRYLMVAYREVSPDDGFIITAYFALGIDRKKSLWKRQ
jgi:hypothetical protein